MPKVEELSKFLFAKKDFKQAEVRACNGNEKGFLDLSITWAFKLVMKKAY